MSRTKLTKNVGKKQPTVKNGVVYWKYKEPLVIHADVRPIKVVAPLACRVNIPGCTRVVVLEADSASCIDVTGCKNLAYIVAKNVRDELFYSGERPTVLKHRRLLPK